MKKSMVSVLTLICVLNLVGCKPNRLASDISKDATTNIQESHQATQEQTQQEQSAEVVENPTETTSKEKEPAVITPLPVTVDIRALEDCSVAVSLEEGDFYTDKTGAVMMDVTVFAYDMYNMVDISLLKEGDTILRGQDEVSVSSIERSENGLVLINGGLDRGGFCLYTEGNTVYYELGHHDTKSYYALGKVSLPVSPAFIYNEASDAGNDAVSFHAEDFLKGAVRFDVPFNADNTTIRIENGLVAEMTRIYAP